MAQQILSTNTFTTVKWIVSATASDGTHTTIGAALTSASSGDTIFIRPGTYTENLTLKSGVNLAAYGCDQDINHVIISGKATFTAAGTVSITGIRLQTNSDFFLAVTGSAASIVNLNNCYLNCSNNTGISFSTSSGSSQININYCTGDLGTTGIGLFSHSSSGTLQVFFSSITNTGGSSTANTASAGTLTISHSIMLSPITTSGTNIIGIGLTNINSSAQNATAVTVGGSGNGVFHTSKFSSGSASAISIGSTLSLTQSTIDSTNTNAITGAGTLNLGEITFSNTSSTINTSTVTSLTSEIGSLILNTALTVANGGTGRATLTNHGVLVGAGTSAITQLSVGASNSVLQGSTSADPSFTTTPQLTALGIGAAAGASGLTFDGTNILANYAVGTFTPTVVGASTAGSTSYTTQVGYYVRIGALVQIQAVLIGTAATGTGNALFGGFPFTVKNQANGTPYGSVITAQTGWPYPASTTSPVIDGTINATTGNIYVSGTGTGGGNLQMANAAFNMQFTLMHQI